MRALTPEEEQAKKEKEQREKWRDDQDMGLFGFRFRKWDRRIQYFGIFGTIALLLAFVLVPMLSPAKNVRLARPLDLGKTVYFRTEEGAWYRISVQDDDVFDKINDMLKGSYDPVEEVAADHAKMPVLMVCRVEDNPLHVYWFTEGMLCDTDPQDGKWKTFKRQTIAFSYEELQRYITENGSRLEGDAIPAWAAELKD